MQQEIEQEQERAAAAQADLLARREASMQALRMRAEVQDAIQALLRLQSEGADVHNELMKAGLVPHPSPDPRRISFGDLPGAGGDSETLNETLERERAAAYARGQVMGRAAAMEPEVLPAVGPPGAALPGVRHLIGTRMPTL